MIRAAKDDIPHLLEQTAMGNANEEKLTLLREYTAFRLFAFYNGSLSSLGTDQDTWKRLLPTIGEPIAKAFVARGLFATEDEFGEFTDQRGKEYFPLWKASKADNPPDNPVLKLARAFTKHVQTDDLAAVAFWGTTWVNWTISDKKFVDKQSQEFRIVE